MRIARRSVVLGLAGLPLATVLADRNLARAAAAELESATITTSGGRTVAAAIAMPSVTPAGTVMLVHEWWGLNDQIKTMARDVANAGYVACAIDLYNGAVATTPADAKKLVTSVDAADATDTVAAWGRWLKGHDKGNGKLATIGWCFGGGWSLNASLAVPADATVVYYGNVAKSAAQLQALKGPVMGHFGTKDKWINKEMVDGFEAEMTAANKNFQSFWYEADHAFANPTGGRYDQADASLAWQRTLEFLASKLA